MNIKKIILAMTGRASAATDEMLFETIAKKNNESFMITVNGDDVKVYMKARKTQSRLAEALSKIAGDAASLSVRA